MNAPGRLRLGVVLAALLPLLFAATLFVQRAGRPLEQGGDAYSDSNAILGGQNFVTLGFLRTHLLPVVVPNPTTPEPLDEEFYTRYPPGADLWNGILRTVGIRSLAGWRLVSAFFSLAGLVFWFLALRRLFGDGVAIAGVATYALNFNFIWLGDSIHHYGYSDFLRSGVFYFGACLLGDAPRRLDTWALAAALFLQSLLAFDYLPYEQVLLLLMGVTGFRGAARRRLLLFAAMPVIGVGLHLIQNIWAFGLQASLDDASKAFLERALASGAGDFERPSVLGLVRHVIWDAHQLMGLGLASILGFAGVGVAMWAGAAPEGERGRALRIVGATLAATSFWFIFMHQHAAEHPYSNRQLLPLASLGAALVIAGTWKLASKLSTRAAWAATIVLALGIGADFYLGFVNDANRRAQVTASFEVAYARRDAVPAGVTVATNIPAPAPPALQVVLDRRVKKARNLAEMEAAFGPGARVVYLYSPNAPIDRELLDRLREGRILDADARGPLVEVTLPSSEPPQP